MLIHLKIIGWLHLVAGAVSILTLLLMYAFYRYNLNVAPDSLDYAPITDLVTMSWLQLLYYLWLVGSSLIFGIGILRYKEWARLLGLFLVFTTFVEMIYTNVAYGIEPDDIGPVIFGAVISVAFNLYISWVLLSKKVRDRCRQGI